MNRMSFFYFNFTPHTSACCKWIPICPTPKMMENRIIQIIFP